MSARSSWCARGAKLIGTNPDLTGPIEGGEIAPACKALMAPIELASGRNAYYLGKPNPLMMRHGIRMLGVQEEDAIVIGDRMDTDIVAGLESGIDTVLVLSGVTTEHEMRKFAYRPTYILNGVCDLVETQAIIANFRAIRVQSFYIHPVFYLNEEAFYEFIRLHDRLRFRHLLTSSWTQSDVVMVYMPYVVDGVEYLDDLGRAGKQKEYFETMRGGIAPKTSLLPISAYLEYFEPHLKAGKDILFLAFSSKMSATLENAKKAREEMLAAYPGRKILIVDTLSISRPMTLLVEKAYALYKQGQSMEEIAKWVEDNRLRAHAWFTVDDLVYLKARRAHQRHGRDHGLADGFETHPHPLPRRLHDRRKQDPRPQVRPALPCG